MAEPSTLVYSRTNMPNRLGMWVAATRPAFLSASVLPVISASAMAFAVSGGKISWLMVFLAVINIIFIHAGANVMNDYYDELSGNDRANTGRIFPFSGGSRFIQNEVLSAEETRNFGIGLLGLGAVLGVAITVLTTPALLLVGLAGGVAAVLYSMPGGLASRGLGDLTIALCFGMLPTLGMSLILLGSIHPYAYWLGAILGLFTAAILWINSIPDIEADRSAHKNTLPARLGADKAKYGLGVLFVLAAILLWIAPFPAQLKLGFAAFIPGGAAFAMLLRGKMIPAIPLTIITHALACLLLAGGFFWVS